MRDGVYCGLVVKLAINTSVLVYSAEGVGNANVTGCSR